VLTGWRSCGREDGGIYEFGAEVETESICSSNGSGSGSRADLVEPIEGDGEAGGFGIVNRPGGAEEGPGEMSCM